MSRKHRTNTTGVSLFPFLDVLVCTMGSLILLLLVATSRIRAAAVEKAKQAAIQERLKSAEATSPASTPIVVATEPEPDDDPTPEWQTRVEQLTDERDTLRSQLSQLRNRLATAQSSVMRTKVKAVSTEDRLKEIRDQQEATAAERQRLQAEIDSLQSDLTDAELQLSKALERQQTAKSQFAFLPFDGRTGTTKRPILIECTQDYIRFLPEDIRLTPADLNGFTTGFNPLLIASRELVHYWKAYERVHAAGADPTKDADSFETDLAALNDKEREPYVLLLVRPNGAVAFHIAKSFLTQLKVPHGYELITDDMEIDSSNPDPEAKQICQAAVTQVLGEREKLLLAITRQREQQREQLQLDTTAKTFVPKENDESQTGFNRPKGGVSPKSSSASGPATASQPGRPTTSAQTNGRTAAGTHRTNSRQALAHREHLFLTTFVKAECSHSRMVSDSPRDNSGRPVVPISAMNHPRSDCPSRPLGVTRTMTQSPSVHRENARRLRPRKRTSRPPRPASRVPRGRNATGQRSPRSQQLDKWFGEQRQPRTDEAAVFDAPFRDRTRKGDHDPHFVAACDDRRRVRNPRRFRGPNAEPDRSSPHRDGPRAVRLAERRRRISLGSNDQVRSGSRGEQVHQRLNSAFVRPRPCVERRVPQL